MYLTVTAAAAAAGIAQVRFVVMANIFVTDLQIHRRYDIKGSTDGRTVGPAGRARCGGDQGDEATERAQVALRLSHPQTLFCWL
jgi:hypothetical protein